jgi:predicted transcriptional regulator
MTELRRLREASGLTQTHAAKVAGCSQPHLALVEAGSRRMAPDREARLRAALEALARRREADRAALAIGQRIFRSKVEELTGGILNGNV